ncbi:MAG: TetR/AcrR family transcriptional regulator [Acidimicrobiales bacterium]|nr:TetR/AcrR family transcriptional regulator [Acidimicrobiales bacterium]
MGGTGGTVDGRRTRGERTRAAIIDELIGLYADGRLDPSVKEIADRVGLTTRAVYHHFPDHEALATAVGERQHATHPELLAPPVIEGSLDERVAGLVAQRAEFFETITPVRRAARVAMHDNPVVAKQQALVAKVWRRQLADTFAEELAGLGPDALDELDLVASWETWERLRVGQGCSRARAERLVTSLLRRALG